MRIKNEIPENRAKAKKLAQDVAAYDALRKRAASALENRPLLRAETTMLGAGARALARDIKVGAYGHTMRETQDAAESAESSSNNLFAYSNDETYQGKRAVKGLL